MKLKYMFLALVSLAMLSSCETIKDDGDDTYCGLFITFKYDYNLQRADMFKDHVGSVMLYVFDSDGNFVRTYEENDVPGMGTLLYDGSYAYCMHITDLPRGDYRFVALAQQDNYFDLLPTPGAKYRRSTLSPGDNFEQLTVTLDRSAALGAKGVSRVNNEAPLDTLWHGMSGDVSITFRDYQYNVTTISMTRDTKMLTIGLHNLDEASRKNISADEFNFYILDNNGTLAYNNSLLPDEDIIYTPYHKWDTTSTDERGNVLDKTAHATITFNRLVWKEQPDQNALLIIENRATGKQVAAINLTDFLAQGRNAYDTYAYSRQEYLDRSYDYYLDFFIKNDTWQYADVRINVLSWAKRIQNVTLK